MLYGNILGRRKLYEWVCAPLCNPDDINQRLDAIETLMQLPSLVAEVKELMKSLPDLQRLLRRCGFNVATPIFLYYFAEYIPWGQL